MREKVATFRVSKWRDLKRIQLERSLQNRSITVTITKKEVTVMKRYFYLSLAIAVLITASSICTQAQSRNRQRLIIEVPFAFNAGNTQLPAGEYNVSIVNPSSDRSVVLIKSSDGQSSALLSTTDIIGWSTSSARLVFRRYDSRYFLAQVWMASEATGMSAPNSKAEKSLRKQLGITKQKADVVAVNAR